MKISYNWLKQFINLDHSPESVAERLTDLGLEVEGIAPFESIPGSLQGVVVGAVLSCEKHPDADKLKITTVDVGQDKPLHIVCGAPNVAAGQKVAVATLGTTFYTAEGEAWKIKKGKIRGQLSEGMICAEDELGLGQSHEGILVLDENAVIGTPLSEVFEVEQDQIFEIGLTPNRADAMSHWGVARDLRAGLLQQQESYELITPSTAHFHIDNRTRKIAVEVEAPDRAPRYCGLTLSGIKVAESPAWLQNRLKALGLNPKNNVVDITNYILHDLGQPLHAFDANKISGDKIVVKTVKGGTPFTTLDEVERSLHEEDLMICDAEKPLCIAGVMGGLDSGVSAGTTAIFLESAYFEPVSIRKSAKRHGINSDASFRFERGIDPNITEYALKCAAILIKEIAGGEITSEIVDLYPKKITDFQVFLSFEKTKKLIGKEIPKETIKQILTALEIKVNNVTESGLGVTIPAYRNDVTRDVDVMEEILRVYGYNQVETGEKLNASISKTAAVEDHKVQNTIAAQLTANGFFEMMANSLTNENLIADDSRSVRILNPLSRELSVLRQDLLYSALETVAYNVNRKNPDLKLFEFGKTYFKKDGAYTENKHLTLTLTGNRNAESWDNPPAKNSFFYLKGVVDSLLNRLGLLSNIQTTPTQLENLSEGLAYVQGESPLVNFGVVKKSACRRFDIDEEVLFADFDWDCILELLRKKKSIRLQEIPKHPAVKRDFALLIDEAVSFQRIYETALQTERKLLKDVSLFDVYTGDKLPQGKKSYAVSFTLQDKDKTLTDKQIEKVMTRLQQRLQEETGAALR